MAYAPPALRRRTRRRRTLAIVLILATLGGVVALAVRYRTDRRFAVGYIDAAKAIVDQETLLAAGLGDVFLGVGTLERQDILERLAELAASSAQLRTTLGDLELTGSVAEIHGFLTVAVGAWDDAMARMDEAVVEVLDGPDDQTGDAMLRSAFNDLRVGDRAYFGFKVAMMELETDIVTQEFRDLEFAGGERAALFDASVLAGRLRAVLKLEGDHDISIIATIDPEPLVQQGSVPIVPNADMFIVSLVVSNAGNLVEERILVSLEGNPQSSDVDPIALQSIVPFLDPGASTSVIFDLSDLIVPGELYELRAGAEIAEDDNQANNSWSLVLIRNAE